jgi:hypothetical protein
MRPIIAEAVHYMVKGDALWQNRPKADVTPAIALVTEPIHSVSRRMRQIADPEASAFAEAR